jgi:hypothetical protein
VNTLMNLLLPYKAGNFLAKRSSITDRLLSITEVLLYVISWEAVTIVNVPFVLLKANMDLNEFSK